MIEGGSWDQPIGTWSNDTSMVLATLDSLPLEYDLEDLSQHFDDWCFQKQYTPNIDIKKKIQKLMFPMGFFVNPVIRQYLTPETN